MSCNISIPLQRIIDDVADAMAGLYIKADNALLTDATIQDVTLRGDISADTEARTALCQIMSDCGVTAVELEWLERPDAVSQIATTVTVAGETEVRWKDLKTLLVEKGFSEEYNTKNVYDSYSTMVADKDKLYAGAVIDIASDENVSRNGTYLYDGVAFSRAPYDPVALAKTYTDTKVEEYVDAELIEFGDNLQVPDDKVAVSAKSGTVARTLDDVLAERVSLGDIYDPSIANYDAVFSQLASRKKGMVIDLEGRELPATGAPPDIQLYNGAIRNGNTTIPLSLTPRSHPLQGNMGVILDDGISHFWCHELIYDNDTGNTLMFVKAAYVHGLSTSSPISMYLSEDGGLSLKSTKAVYSKVGYAVSEVRGDIMANGRYGLFLTVNRPDGVYSNTFVYSDDKGKTWLSIEDVCLSNFAYSDMMQHPDNDNTFFVYGYIGGKLQIAKTINNGMTWTNTTVNMGVTFTEPSVVKVPGQNKWLMFIRTLDFMYISTSDDMENWSTPRNSNVDLGANPVQAFIEHGKLYVYLFIRDFSERLSSQNTVLLLVDDYDYVYENKQFRNPENRLPIFTGIDRNLGYMRVKPMRTGKIFSLNTGEYDGDATGVPSTSGGTSSKVMLGSTQMAGVPLLAKTRANHFRNPRFDFWSRGDTFTSSSNGKTADGWSTSNSGSTITTTKVLVPYEISQSLPFKPKYGMKIVASAEDYIGIAQEDHSPTAISSSQNQILTVQVWGVGKVPTLELNYSQNFGVGGSATNSNSGYTLDVGPVGDGKIWHGTGRIPIKSAEGKVIGPGSFLRIAILSRVFEEWDCTILGVHAAKTSQLTPFTVSDYNESAERTRCEEYVQSFSYPSAFDIAPGFAATDTSFQGVLQYFQKIKTPTVTITGPLAQYPRGMELTTPTVTAVSQTNATIRTISATPLVAGAAGVIRAGASPVKVVIDAE